MPCHGPTSPPRSSRHVLFPGGTAAAPSSRASSTPASTLLIRPSPHSSALPLALREEKPRPARPADVPPSPSPSRKSSSADKSESISATPTTPARRPAASSGERAKTSAPSLPPTPSRSGGRRARARPSRHAGGATSVDSGSRGGRRRRRRRGRQRLEPLGVAALGCFRATDVDSRSSECARARSGVPPGRHVAAWALHRHRGHVRRRPRPSLR